MSGEVDQGAVVNDAASRLADDRRLHAVIEDLAGDSVDRLESSYMATVAHRAPKGISTVEALTVVG